MEHSKVRIICDSPLLTLYLYILIHARRRQDSRRTIDLLVTNPRITEWPRPGTVRSEALPLCPVLKFKERKNVVISRNLLLTRGHFITGLHLYKQLTLVVPY